MTCVCGGQIIPGPTPTSQCKCERCRKTFRPPGRPMNKIYPPPVKVDFPVPVDRSKSQAILRWLNYQQSLENLEARLASLREEVKGYEKAIIERTLEITQIEKEFFGDSIESQTGPNTDIADGEE